MLVLSALNALLAQLTSEYLHTALLVTPQGQLVTYAADGEYQRHSAGSSAEDRVRILAALGCEVWREAQAQQEQEQNGDANEEGVATLECELGRLLVMPIHAKEKKKDKQPVMVLILNADDEETWGLLHTKARALAKYLEEPLASVGDKLSGLGSATVPGVGAKARGWAGR